jgi:two-component system, NarL family, nitrate/nitrite response regulator NarL
MGKIVKGSEELLSSRERNMVKLVRAGLRNREIAEKLGVTEGTVKVYLNRIYKKTGARNRTELAVRAAEWGTSS